MFSTKKLSELFQVKPTPHHLTAPRLYFVQELVHVCARMQLFVVLVLLTVEFGGNVL